MILTAAGIVILFLTFLRFAVAFVNAVSRPYLSGSVLPDEHLPSLSVLIPVRNEEKNIGALLASLLPLQYPDAEILVYDDGSTDGSAAVILDFAAKDNRVRYISGTALPEGWTGKNHACHMLASAARGDFLLYLDADVTVGADLLRRAVSCSVKNRLTLLSIFPSQEMKTRGEKIVIPFMDRILLSLLPLFLVRRCSWTSFSAANGQMMLFSGEDYRRIRFHERLKNRLAEDIEIMRLIKRSGLRGDTLVGRDEIKCRMYADYRSAVSGFSKNILSMFGNSWIFLMLFALTGLFGWVVLIFLPWYFIALYLFMVISLNALIAYTSRQRILTNLKWLIPGIFAFYNISFLAVRARFTGRHEWKGREIINSR